jgi:GAF domain-containing protein
MLVSADLLERHLGIRADAKAEESLRLLIWTGLQLTKAGEGSLLVLDRDASVLRFAITMGADKSGDSEKTLIGQAVPLGAGISGLAAATGEVQIGAPTFRDVKQSQKIEGEPEAVIAAPVMAGGDLAGVLTCVSFAPGKRFSIEDGRLYGGFAAVAGTIIEQRRRLTQLEAAASPAGADPVRAEINAIAGRLPQGALPDVLALLKQIERLAGRAA